MYVGSYRSALYGALNSKKSLPKYSIGDRDILNKRIYSNPKFTSVTSRTNSGFNSRRKEELQNEIKKYYKVSNNEVFSRISVSDLMQLMIAYTQQYYQHQVADPERHTTLHHAAAEGGNLQQDEDVDTVTQMKGLKVKVTSETEVDVTAPPLTRPPYLLVDIREPANYQSVHVISAINHHLSRLSRSVNWECKELLIYRNKPDLIIVIYDDNEDHVAEYAYTLIHRGYENIFVLSGGLKLAIDKFGYPLVLDKSELSKRQSVQTLGHCYATIPEDSAAIFNENCSADDTPDVFGPLEDVFNLSNSVVPVGITDVLTDQLASVILPPLSAKGDCAEYWMNGSTADGGNGSIRGPNSVYNAGSTRTASIQGAKAAAGSTVSTNRTERSTASQKPWR